MAKESCGESFVTLKLHDREENLGSGKVSALNLGMKPNYPSRGLASLSCPKTGKYLGFFAIRARVKGDCAIHRD